MKQVCKCFKGVRVGRCEVFFKDIRRRTGDREKGENPSSLVIEDDYD
jgi:hypothetical protein